MKTKIKNTLWLSVFTGVILASNVNDAKAQDDIYFVQAKKSDSPTVSSNQNISKDTSGMTDYERYRAYRDGYANKNESKSDSANSRDELAKKKGMERYSGRNVENDSSAYVNNNQNYSGQQPSDPPQDGATIVNNYYDDGYCYDRFYHRCYFGYDPFLYDYYDPFYFGFSFGYPFFGFGLGLYAPFWGYGYRSYYGFGGYYGGHGYYNHYGYNNGYINSGGMRTASSSIGRPGIIGNQAMSSAISSSRRSAVTRTVTASSSRGATYDAARSRAAWQSYQTTSSSSNIATTRRASGNSSTNYSRSLSVPTTRLANNSRGYSPSYSVPGNSTRRNYNSSGNTSYSQPRRSSGNFSAPARTSSAHISSGSSGSSHSSGSSSSGHFGGGGGGGHHGR